MKEIDKRIRPILDWLERRQEGVCIIAIDGRCASGKTTMAKRLCELTGAGVIHMDDFFLPGQLRTKQRLLEPGGNVHYERFLKEVLPFLLRSEAFSYTRFDCGRMEPGEKRQVAASRLRVVEGAYGCHPALGDYAALRVFSDVSPKVQEERILKRNGAEGLANFQQRWIPMEEAYFAAYDIKEKADFIV